MAYKHNKSKATDISPKVKKIVAERDSVAMRGEGVCIVCGGPGGVPNMHYISRAQGGLGIEENIVTGCIRCHNNFDFGSGDIPDRIGERIREYLKGQYPDWDESKLVYDKWEGFEVK